MRSSRDRIVSPQFQGSSPSQVQVSFQVTENNKVRVFLRGSIHVARRLSGVRTKHLFEEDLRLSVMSGIVYVVPAGEGERCPLVRVDELLGSLKLYYFQDPRCPCQQRSGIWQLANRSSNTAIEFGRNLNVGAKICWVLR